MLFSWVTQRETLEQRVALLFTPGRVQACGGDFLLSRDIYGLSD